MAPATYDAGIYMLRSKRTGARYVGKTTNLPLRRRTHLGQIACGTCPMPLLRAVFSGHGADEVEFTILERVTVRHSADTDTADGDDWYAMSDRERHWINQLKPEANMIGGCSRAEAYARLARLMKEAAADGALVRRRERATA